MKIIIEDLLDQESALIRQLIKFTENWDEYTNLSIEDQILIKKAGFMLFQMGRMPLMERAYERIHSMNPYTSVISLYWDKVGDWKC